jgi:hypothetical protein
MPGMKRSIFSLAIFLSAFTTGLIAQNCSEGVYLSANDFTKGKISFANDHADKRYQLRVDESPKVSSITIVYGDRLKILAKDSIFGFRDKKGKIFRFYKKALFELLNPAEKILLYSGTGKPGPGEDKAGGVNYYFSETVASPVYPLTKRNLKIVFSNDARFSELLDVCFHFDDELIAYDSGHKIYFLNRIYNESKLETEEYGTKLIQYESKCAIFNNNIN